MTKKVRIENADQSTFNVIVETWLKGNQGQPDRLIESKDLGKPCDLKDFWIHKSQYLIVKELG